MKSISFFKEKKLNQHRLARRNYYQKTKPKTRFIFFVILFFIIIGAIVYFFIFSSICQVKKINIVIDDYEILRYSPQEIEDYIKNLLTEKYFLFIPVNSLTLFPANKVVERLKIDSRVESFSIEKKAPNILNIYLKIFEPTAILLNLDQKMYLLNEDGYKIQEINKNKGVLPIIESRVENNKNIRLEKIIQFIKDINNNFDFMVDLVEIYEDKGIINTRAITSERWQIYFDTNTDLELQTTNLFLILRESITNRSELSYVDLRFGQKIFYK